MKLKRHHTIPLVLFIYLIGISIYTWPGRNPEVSYLQYGITILVTLICIIALSYFIQKRDALRKNNKK